MPTSKRAALFAFRCIALIVALGFLVFYVWRAQARRNAVFSSSKNLRAVYSSGDRASEQWFLEPVAKDTITDPASAPGATPPALFPPSDTTTNRETMPDSFHIGIFPPAPEMLAGSKSMSLPPVDGMHVLRFWTIQSENFLHTFGLPFSNQPPSELKFGEPTINVRVNETENRTETPAPMPTTAGDEPIPGPPAPTPTAP